MTLAAGRRASSILYNLLASRSDRRPFLIPANICPVVPLTFLKAGFPFELVDIDPSTLSLDLNAGQELLHSGRFGGFLFSHSYGDPATPTQFFTWIKHFDPGILVVDDRCLCLPDLVRDPENPADVVLYSSGYSKIVDLGFGGYAFLAPAIEYHQHELPFSPAALERVERSYKSSLVNRAPFLYQEGPWLQMEPVPIWEDYSRQIEQAIPVTRAHRLEINALYRSLLPAELIFPEQFQFWRFNLRLTDKTALLLALKGAGLLASSHYASLAGIFCPGECPQAALLHAHVVNLFNDHHYTLDMAEQTCGIIRKLL